MKWKLWLIVLGLFGLIVLYTFEFQWFDHTIQKQWLVFSSLIVGGILGTVAAFQWKMPDMDDYDKMRIRVTIIALSIVFMPLFGSLLNRFLATAPATLPYIFVKEQYFYQSRYGRMQGEEMKPTGVFTYVVNLKGDTIRLRSNKPRFLGSKPGENVYLQTSKGLLGFQVLSFEEENE